MSFNVFSSELEKELIINVPAGSEDNSYFMTGDFCQWEPDCLRLGSLNEFSIKIPFFKGLNKSRIKITKGSWESEACGSNGRPLENIELHKYKKLQVINIETWCDSKETLGKRFFFYYYFKSLKKYRRVSVYIPQSYKKETENSSFILFLDGQNIFDASRSAFGYEWRADETSEALELEDKILVSIDNGGRYRTEEYHYFKKGKAFAEEIAGEFIDSLCEEHFYKKSCGNNTIIGSSLGAIFAFTTAYSNPGVFSKSISLSFPAFAYDDFVFKYLNEEISQPPSDNTFYFDFGGFGQDADYDIPFSRFISNESIQRLNFIWKKFPFHGHNELNWGQRLPFILKQVL